MKIFGKQLVDVGHLQGLEAANKQLQEANKLGSKQVEILQQNVNTSVQVNARLAAKIIELEQIISDNKFLPNNKPNLELAAKTVAAWGNNRTIASFFKKLIFLVDDSMVETIVRYANTEVKKRKLNLEVK